MAEVVEITETAAESKVSNEVVTENVSEVVSESVVESDSEVVQEVVTKMVDSVSEIVIEKVMEVADQVVPEDVENVFTDSSAKAGESVTEFLNFQSRQEEFVYTMKSILPPNVFDSFADYFEEPRTGICPRFEAVKETIQEVIDVSKEMTEEALKEIADKALMSKLKEVDSDVQESVDKVSGLGKETGVIEVNVVKSSESESDLVGKIVCEDEIIVEKVSIPDTPCLSCSRPCTGCLEKDTKYQELKQHADLVKFDLEQVLDDDSEKFEKAKSVESGSDSEEDGNFLDRYLTKKDKSADDDSIMVAYTMVGSDKLYSNTKFPLQNVKFENIQKVFKLIELSVNELKEKDFFSKLNKSVGSSRPTSPEKASPNVLFDPVHNSCIDLDVEKCPLLSEFSSILDYMNRIPVKKAMIDQRPLYRSHISRFWINAKYDEESKVISSVVEVDGKLETILVTEALVREVMNFPDEANYPTRFPERMVKGCMLRLGYRNTLNTGNYLKSKFQKSFKFLIHCILISLSHTKGSFDQMRDYQMNMLTALVLNKKYNFSHIVFHYMVENLTSDVRTWRYPRFVQMMIDRAYPGIDRNIKGDLLVQAHMSNNTLKNLVKYHPNHPEPDLVIENFGLLRDVNYVDPDPENHQNWRNQEEMKEALYAVELKIVQGFKPTKNESYVKELGRRRRFATPVAVAEGEGSSSKPKKIQRKKKQTMLIDESDEEIPEMNVENEQETTGAENIVIETDLFTTEAYFVDNVVETDAKERERRMREEVEQDKLIRKRKREEKEDALYEPSPEHVSVSQSSPKDLFGTPPLTQAQPGSSSRGLPIPQDNLLDVDFDFANNSQVLKLEKRIDDVIAENKKLAAECKKIAEREKSLAGKVQRLEGENKVLTLKIEVDQTEIDVLKVRVSELEEEKNRRESENEYYKLKYKELMAAKALHEHKFYMLNRVVESMLETSVEQKYEELKLEDLRAERKAELERQMKDKGKGVGGSSVMSIVPSMVIDNPEPISAVPDADIYDRVEVEEGSDNEEAPEDTSKLPTLMEFFAAENRDELRQKVTEAMNDNVFECLRKEAEQKNQSNADKEDQSKVEEIDRSKWFKDSHERKFKRPLKFFQRDRNVSLGDIISWGFLPQVNAYAIRREYGVQYFARLYDIMSLPWWDVDELAKVRVLEYKVRQNDTAMWGYIKYKQLKSFRKWKPHRPRRVQRIDPETGAVEVILNVKPPRTMKTIPMPEMEQDFYKGFIDWVYSCRTTEAIITYRAGGELRDIHVYDPMWLVNCSAKDIECLFIHKIRYSPADKEQALQFQRVVSLCI
ncbi:uncharacterized protein LOC110870582 [Helianthus annuus]|uniref:uncharacterized protein LOC110870582 n=1 Tax=Helianthus annuus TaxID=4232 RepID=UPI001652CC22|nr:uncharacterized protein LOC110870582 [Helianthus annuus]